MFQEAYMKKTVVLVGAAAVLALLTYSYAALTEIKYIHSGPATISVEGKGEVFAAPDIASFNFNVEAKEDDAVSAQNKVSEIMDTVLVYLKESGVEEKDVKTNTFNLSPRYEYPDSNCNEWGYCPRNGEPILVGYEVNQSVTVKIRDTEKAGEIISAVGEKGAMNVSRLSFTIDDEEILLAEAREKAIKDAREKAEVLAKNLDARIVRMNGYWEENNGYPMPHGGRMESMMAFDAEESVSVKSASLPMGENTFTVQVNISYEIK